VDTWTLEFVEAECVVEAFKGDGDGERFVHLECSPVAALEHECALQCECSECPSLVSEMRSCVRRFVGPGIEEWRREIWSWRGFSSLRACRVGGFADEEEGEGVRAFGHEFEIHFGAPAVGDFWRVGCDGDVGEGGARVRLFGGLLGDRRWCGGGVDFGRPRHGGIPLGDRQLRRRGHAGVRGADRRVPGAPPAAVDDHEAGVCEQRPRHRAPGGHFPGAVPGAPEPRVRGLVPGAVPRAGGDEPADPRVRAHEEVAAPGLRRRLAGQGGPPAAENARGAPQAALRRQLLHRERAVEPAPERDRGAQARGEAHLLAVARRAQSVERDLARVAGAGHLLRRRHRLRS
jgi:hypothetical protein